MAKIYFTLDSTDFTKLEQAIKNYPANAEDAINSYLADKGQDELINDMTPYIPLSAKPRSNRHARTAKWYEVEFKNLEVDISNSTKGTRKTSFYYLYYVATSTGTSAPEKRDTGVGGIDFFTEGADKAYPTINEELLDILSDKLKEEL